MARARTGSVETFTAADGSPYHKARIRLADGSRVRVDIPAKAAVDEESRATYARDRQLIEDGKHPDPKFAKHAGAILKKKRRDAEALKPAPRGGMTLDDYRDKLAELRVAEGIASVAREQRTWNARVSPKLGRRTIASLTRDDVENFRDYLDGEVREHIKHGDGHGLAGKSALTIWSLLRSALDEAVNCRDRSMRVRADDPSIGIKPPLKSAKRKKTFFYPTEFAQLMACAAVPVEWRQVYAIAAYLYLRPGELRALTWGDVDLDAGIVHITKAFDEEAQRDKAPKTESGIRDVPIEPALAALLAWMKNGKDATAAVVPVLSTLSSESKRAPLFREHLRTAKLSRSGLFKNTATTLMVNFRTLRDSGITWLALARVEPMRIQSRAGHEKFDTTLGYVKMAEDLTGKIGVPFGPLPFAPAAGGNGPSTGQVAAVRNETLENPSEDELRLLDSNQRPGG